MRGLGHKNMVVFDYQQKGFKTQKNINSVQVRVYNILSRLLLLQYIIIKNY